MLNPGADPLQDPKGFREGLIEIRSHYRRVFNTPDGKLVLADILDLLGFYNMHAEGQEALVLHNVAREILYRFGAWDSQNAVNIVEALAALPWQPPEIQENVEE